MTDITKCSGEGCGMKETCYRFTAPAGMLQSYFDPPVNDGKCDYKMAVSKVHMPESYKEKLLRRKDKDD